ncbi:unnamed protein product [Closterium sp. NIES-54]
MEVPSAASSHAVAPLAAPRAEPLAAPPAAIAVRATAATVLRATVIAHPHASSSQARHAAAPTVWHVIASSAAGATEPQATGAAGSLSYQKQSPRLQPLCRNPSVHSIFRFRHIQAYCDYYKWYQSPLEQFRQWMDLRRGVAEVLVAVDNPKLKANPVIQPWHPCNQVLAYLGMSLGCLGLTRTSKLGEHEESGAAAKKQHKNEENPKAAAEEYGDNMWGTIASAAFSNPTSATGECDWLNLHRRMGHVALPILQQLVKNEMVAGIRVKGEPDEVLGCPTCMQAKFTRFPFSSSEAMAKAPLDEVVMDVVAPLKLRAARAEYFLTIVDVYTWMTWVYVLSKKSDVVETVKTDWLPMVERQQDQLVKAICTDRGGEFLSKEFSLWLKKNGIRHSLTMPYSPAMNGIAEQANRTITETARGLLIEAGLPDYFWPDAVRSACVAKNRALTHVRADKWVPYVEWIGRKPNVDMLRVFRCMCMALVPKHLRHNKLGAKAIWAVHLGMAQNSKGWLLWDPFTKKLLVSRDCKFMENLMYKDWKAENEAKIGMRFGEVKCSGLEHVELRLELSSSSTATRQYLLVNGGEEANDAEEEEEEVQQVSERAPTLSSRTTSALRIRVTPQQCHESLHVSAAEEEGSGKRRIQAPNRLTYEAQGKPAKSALAGAALIVGDDEESDYDECAFTFFSPVEMPGEPATLKEALESSDAEEWKKAMESELKSIEENDTWELVELSEGRKVITSKWLFKIKSDADRKIEHYKSRLVAKGYQQKEKVDYKELFAHVV